ncbi:hypothetical protein PG996_009154 [Apiospora saccharicola]|uniref:Uncharacterized protein n=1 Tax=Apiospora saccharicola TaxID=335842 RepID=A0ABR1UMZ4_9PEZI
MPSSQRPFFLSSFFAAFRLQAPPSASALSASQQSKTHTHNQSSGSSGSTPGAARGIASSTPVPNSSTGSATAAPGAGSVMNQLPIHSPRAGHAGVPIPNTSSPGGSRGQRRGSDSSSEGFRDARGADKWYIGGRTAGGEEKFFKLGVVKRVRSNDRLSLDRLSL